MSARFVNVDRRTPMLLPPDLRDWIPGDHPARVVVDLMEQLDCSTAAINPRRSGSEQYPPAMMLALLRYSYSQGLFSSRRIEQATYTDVAVRFITADHHPDHDTICTFRRRNRQLIQDTFAQSLRLAGADLEWRLISFAYNLRKLSRHEGWRQQLRQRPRPKNRELNSQYTISPRRTLTASSAPKPAKHDRSIGQ